MTTRPTILVLDADPALLGLLREWLAELGQVAAGRGDARVDCDLVVVDVPYPRQGESNPLRGLAAAHPGTPVLALSPTFFAGIDAHGAVARSLGVAGVLPKPVAREALVAAVRRLLPPQGP
jgi:DNA-binding NarL/FixJ family response regulator